MFRFRAPMSASIVAIALLAAALAALTRELARTGNPSSLHGSGRRARRSVEDAREVLAAAAGAHPSE